LNGYWEKTEEKDKNNMKKQIYNIKNRGKEEETPRQERRTPTFQGRLVHCVE
jgi:hypothetical protein